MFPLVYPSSFGEVLRSRSVWGLCVMVNFRSSFLPDVALLQNGLPWATASQGFPWHEFPVSVCPSEVTSSDTELLLPSMHLGLFLQQCLLQCIFSISSSPQQHIVLLEPALAEEPCASVTCWIFTTWWSANTCFRAAEPSWGQHKTDGLWHIPSEVNLHHLVKTLQLLPSTSIMKFYIFFKKEHLKKLEKTWRERVREDIWKN